MDIEMPIKNGYKASQEIKQFFKEKSVLNQSIIVACTAFVTEQDKQKALLNGMDDYINKPVFKKGLENLLKNYEEILFDKIQ